MVSAIANATSYPRASVRFRYLRLLRRVGGQQVYLLFRNFLRRVREGVRANRVVPANYRSPNRFSNSTSRVRRQSIYGSVLFWYLAGVYAPFVVKRVVRGRIMGLHGAHVHIRSFPPTLCRDLTDFCNGDGISCSSQGLCARYVD